MLYSASFTARFSVSVQSGSALAHQLFMSYVILIYFSEGASFSLVSHTLSPHGALPLLNANSGVQIVAPKCAVSNNAYLLAITSSNFSLDGANLTVNNSRPIVHCGTTCCIMRRLHPCSLMIHLLKLSPPAYRSSLFFLTFARTGFPLSLCVILF